MRILFRSEVFLILQWSGLINFSNLFMLKTTVHLSTCSTFQQTAQVNHCQNIIDAFIESCKALDVSIFEPFMAENNVFEEKTKYLFLAGLKKLFDSYKDEKIFFHKIVVEDGSCTGCNNGKSVKIFSFKGWGRIIKTDHFAYVIERENGILTDIYRCNLFCKS
ncbi:hypothetical protein [Ferruginibacter sp.]|nr:hypothetical protein [Ferruginibacter sp.]